MDKQERELTAEVLKAMAHPVRLGVIEILANGEKTCTELFEELQCSQSMMSQQLKILAQQGLVSIRKEGTLKCEGDMGTMNRKQEPEPEPQPTAPAICRYCEGKGPYAGGKCDECE